ncbi:von Willebrand factor D and EGF domain-containing protein-like [Saccostrea echinata]|uniref:von Willebrand factor D and EGF domain-containing protein-like n=1 Tax=Saccostrea echinata TaxID=191078 RepID=UPI002A81B995|nr:von Willebrand factor D and EGF domain-containing protein-like [Saccostrea echinata]
MFEVGIAYADILPENTVTVDPPTLSLTPQVVATRDSSTSGTSLEPVMRCQFPQPADGSLLYNIQWYINNNPLANATFTKIEYNNLNISTALRPNHWTGTYRLNMNVNCSVSAQYSNSVPGSTFTSPKFFAGVKVNQTFVDVDEGQTVAIEVTSTLPVGCSVSLSESEKETNCKGTLYIRTTEYWPWCWNGVKYLSAAFPDNGCQLHFSYKYWYEPVQLNITGYMDGMRNWWYKSTDIKLEPGTDSNHLAWGNMQFDDTIAVRVHDKDTSGGGICSSYNDPHMQTFDGIYWENQRVGEFVMYRHKSKPFSVHALFSACVPGFATCNCGVAVKSGNSLYVVRTCTRVSASRVQLLSVPYELMDGCDPDAIAVQKTGSRYRVTLPNGVEVTFALSGWDNWISYVQIVAPSSDFDKTEGLCGTYNGDTSDDFIPKGQQSPVADEKTFAVSWRVAQGSSDSLFINSPTLSSYSLPSTPTTTPATLYCTCSSYQSANQNPGYAHCQLESPTEPCSEYKSQTVSVCTQSRRKRSTSGTDDVIDTPSFSYDPDYDQELQEATWTNGWNETAATDYCNKTFALDPVVSFCIEQVNTSITKYVNGCISDIEKIGNTDFVEATLDTLKKECVTTASRDESFQKSDNSSSNSTDGESVSILDVLSTMVCPKNCSQKGACVNETCLCNEGYIGDDCSSQLSVPPSDLSVPEHGLCDTSKRACKKTNVVGTFNSEQIIANLIYFQSTRNGMERQDYSVSTNVTYRHMNLVTVSLPDSPSSRRRKRSAGSNIYGWIIQLSYDGTSFGNSTTILLFNSLTESCEATTLICTVKPASANDTSLPQTEADNLLLYTGISVGGVVFLIIIAFILYIKTRKKELHHKRISRVYPEEGSGLVFERRKPPETDPRPFDFS